jgi:hypothetical protein
MPAFQALEGKIWVTMTENPDTGTIWNPSTAQPFFVFKNGVSTWLNG